MAYQPAYTTTDTSLQSMVEAYAKRTDHWCGICQRPSSTLCRNYEGCEDYHRFNICEDCARKEGYLW